MRVQNSGSGSRVESRGIGFMVEGLRLSFWGLWSWVEGSVLMAGLRLICWGIWCRFFAFRVPGVVCRVGLRFRGLERCRSGAWRV